MRPGRSLLRIFGVAGAFVLSGCFTYLPLERAEPGTEVRVRVPVTTRVGGTERQIESVPVEGRVVSWGDSLYLFTRSEQVGVGRMMGMADTIAFDVASLDGIEEKVFSRGRTAALSGVILVGVGAILLAIAETGGGDQGGGGKTPPPQSIRIPLPIPFPR